MQAEAFAGHEAQQKERTLLERQCARDPAWGWVRRWSPGGGIQPRSASVDKARGHRAGDGTAKMARAPSSMLARPPCSCGPHRPARPAHRTWGDIRLSLRSTAQPLYTRFPVTFGSCFSKVTTGYNPSRTRAARRSCCCSWCSTKRGPRRHSASSLAAARTCAGVACPYRRP
jgi:hypothetical protein